MKFCYLGDKTEMVAFGYDFSNHAVVDVTDEAVITKLSGNNHFEAVVENPVVEHPGQADTEADWPNNMDYKKAKK